MPNQHPAAFCRQHGFFPATAIALAPGVSNVTIQGMSTNCPTCGQTSEIVPGAYSALADGMNLLLDPSVSAEILAALQSVVERARDNDLPIEEAKRQAEQVLPGSGRLFDVRNWSDTAKATLYAGVIGAIALIIAARISSSSPPPPVIVNPVIERVIERPSHWSVPPIDRGLESYMQKNRSGHPAKRPR